MSKKRRLLADVLSPEQLEIWRREGLTCDEIGEKVGFSGKTISAYGRKVLPQELLGKGKKIAKKKPEPISRMDQIKAELKKAREQGEEKARQTLAKEEQARDEEATTRVAEVREKIEKKSHQMVAESALIHFAQDCLGEGLFVATNGRDTATALISGPGGLEDLLIQQKGHKAWCDFLAELAPDGGLDRLTDMVPPFYVRNEADRLEHLRQIAAGYVVATRRAREAARRFLTNEGQPVLDRSTAHRLELLARVARWLIARGRGIDGE